MNNSTDWRDLQALFSGIRKFFSVVVHVEVFKGPGGADGVVGVQNVDIHKAHGLARADDVALGEDLRPAHREKVVDIGAAGDGGALLGAGKARREAGGRVHDGADEAAVDLAVEVQVVGLDRDAHEDARLRRAGEQLTPAIADKADHPLLRGLWDLVFHGSASCVFSQYSTAKRPWEAPVQKKTCGHQRCPQAEGKNKIRRRSPGAARRRCRCSRS